MTGITGGKVGSGCKVVDQYPKDGEKQGNGQVYITFPPMFTCAFVGIGRDTVATLQIIKDMTIVTVISLPGTIFIIPAWYHAHILPLCAFYLSLLIAFSS